jgi:hypothetical protein
MLIYKPSRYEALCEKPHIKLSVLDKNILIMLNIILGVIIISTCSYP